MSSYSDGQTGASGLPESQVTPYMVSYLPYRGAVHESVSQSFRSTAAGAVHPGHREAPAVAQYVVETLEAGYYRSRVQLVLGGPCGAGVPAIRVFPQAGQQGIYILFWHYHLHSRGVRAVYPASCAPRVPGGGVLARMTAQSLRLPPGLRNMYRQGSPCCTVFSLASYLPGRFRLCCGTVRSLMSRRVRYRVFSSERREGTSFQAR